ncbi:type IV secretory system conjugative DNA transfer family protein [Oceanobacillus kimchii]|uniref:type IV secretory system conjugative DNA transfer family protein n=1 Tax=Oceanobacillus kimchii TaxID=746691 RepID=UPI003C731E29
MARKSNDELAKEFGFGGAILVGMLFLFPLLIFAIPFFIIFRLIKQEKIKLVISIVSLLIFVFTLIYDFKAYFAIYGILPFDMNWIAELINTELVFTNVSWVLYVTGGFVSAYVWSRATDYIRSKRVDSKESKRDKFKASSSYEKIYKKRFKITAKVQKRWRKMVKAGKNDKLLLGITEAGKPYYIDFKEINQHLFTPATTGGGKTVLLLNLIEYSLIKNYPMFFIDGKGSKQSIDDVRALCEKYGKKMKLFSDTEKLTYNPIKHGNSTVITDKLQALVETESEYYVKVNEVLVQNLIQFIDEYGMKRDLWSFAEYLDPAEIKKVLNSDVETITIEEKTEVEPQEEFGSFLDGDAAVEVATEPKVKKTTKTIRSERADRFYKRFFSDWESTEEGELYLFANASVVRLAITSLLDKELGQLFKEKEDGVDLIQLSNNKEALFISFDGLIYDKYIKSIARFFILDINFLVSYRNRNNLTDEPILAIYDEFSVYANDKIVDTVNKSRSGGFHCVISTQTLADLEKVNPQLAKQIVGNTNTYAIGQTNNPEDVEFWANQMGTYKDVDITNITEKQKGSLERKELKGDKGTARFVQKYKIPPNDIRDLRQGQFVIARKASRENVEPEIVYVRHPLIDK